MIPIWAIYFELSMHVGGVWPYRETEQIKIKEWGKSFYYQFRVGACTVIEIQSIGAVKVPMGGYWNIGYSPI